MKLLISPTDEKEAEEAILGGADIIDVKNPKEGPLGASFPWIIKRIQKATPPHIEVSCTIGDVPYLPGTASLAALGAATLGVNYIKAGLLGLRTSEDAVFVMRSIVKSVRDFDSSIKIVATGYADAERIGSVSPMLIPRIASEAECDFAMLDTAIKDGKTLFDCIAVDRLRDFVKEAHSNDLQTALAGGLKKEHLLTLCTMGVDIAGLRGAACANGDRLHGRITHETVFELAETIKKANCGNKPFL